MTVKPEPAVANGTVEKKPESKLEGLMKSRQAPAAEEAKVEEPPPAPATQKKARTIWDKVDDVVNSAVFQRRAGFALMALAFVGVDMILAFWWGLPAPVATPAADTIPALVDQTPTPTPPQPPRNLFR